MCDYNSNTWSNHIQLLCLKSDLPSLLSLLQSTPWPKSSKTWVTIWHEKFLKEKSLTNSKMKYLNVQLLGLSGQPHKVLHNISTTQEAKKLRLNIKFLTNDYMTNERRSLDQPSISSACVLCEALLDSTEHVLASCRSTSHVRDRLLPELLNTVAMVQPLCQILEMDPSPSPHILIQFVLECSSPNIQNPSAFLHTIQESLKSIKLVERD